MILARISRAIREQSWFAVALEFVIVISGVVIGFQVTAWNAERNNQARVELAIERLQIETEQNVAALRRRIASNEARADGHAVMVAVAMGSTLNEADAEAFETAVAQLMYFSRVPVRRSTYLALEQSGDLALISDPELIVDLNRYQTLLEWVASQHSGFRNGLSGFSDDINQFVFHEPTTDPTRTRVRVDFDRLAGNPRLSSALVQMARMHAIFAGYTVTLEAQTLVFCHRLSEETGRPCNVEATP